jgi:hypothetical protein
VVEDSAKSKAAKAEAELIKQQQADRLNAVKVSTSEAEAALSTLSPEERRQRRLQYLMAQVNINKRRGRRSVSKPHRMNRFCSLFVSKKPPKHPSPFRRLLV